jgi:hypothetical protein
MTFKANHKYILILLIFSLSGTHLAYSQKFAVGIKAGATLSKSSFGDKDDNDDFTNLWVPGYFGAGLVNFQLKNNFSFQTEAEKLNLTKARGKTMQPIIFLMLPWC